MKIIVFFFVILFFKSELSSAQYVNDKDIRVEAGKYIKAWTEHIFLARGRFIHVDYGQDYYLENNSKSFLRDENGEKIRLYSTIQIINYFHDLGFVYEDSCRPMSDDGCWIFKRQKKPDSFTD